MFEKLKIKRWILTCVAASLLLLIAAVWLVRYFSLHVSPLAFDSQAWCSDRTWLGYDRFHATPRQAMMRDLITKVLPGKNKRQIEELLGPSLRDKTSPPDYFSTFDWDLIYPIGKERIFYYDHKGVAMSPDCEYLHIRVNQKQVFESWWVDGSDRWPEIVGKQGSETYRLQR